MYCIRHNFTLKSIGELIHNKLLSRKVSIINEFGIHARPAAMIAKIAQKAEKTVWIGSEGDRADASSVIDILSICGKKGNLIILEIETENDIGVLESIAQLIKQGFGEKIDE